jgi:hypothetical protein
VRVKIDVLGKTAFYRRAEGLVDRQRMGNCQVAYDMWPSAIMKTAAVIHSSVQAGYYG